MKFLNLHITEASSFMTTASSSSTSSAGSGSQCSAASDKCYHEDLSSSSSSCPQGFEHDHPIHVWYFFKERRTCNCDKKGSRRRRRRRIQNLVERGLGDSNEQEGLQKNGKERTSLLVKSPSTSMISAITLPDELPPVAEAEAGSKFDTYYSSTADTNPRKPIRSCSSIVGD